MNNTTRYLRYGDCAPLWIELRNPTEKLWPALHNRSAKAMRYRGRLPSAVPSFTVKLKGYDGFPGLIRGTAHITDKWSKLNFE